MDGDYKEKCLEVLNSAKVSEKINEETYYYLSDVFWDAERGKHYDFKKAWEECFKFYKRKV